MFRQNNAILREKLDSFLSYFNVSMVGGILNTDIVLCSYFQYYYYYYYYYCIILFILTALFQCIQTCLLPVTQKGT
jgi:hypothetical protein